MGVFSENAIIGASAAGGYDIEQSLRFNSADTPTMTHTPAGAGNRTTWTFSCWVKRCESTDSGSTGAHSLLSSAVASGVTAGKTDIRFTETNDLLFQNYYYHSPDEYNYLIRTNAKYRDPGAWYHVVAVWDTSNGTADNRMRLYVNGEQVTSMQLRTNPSSSFESHMNSGTAFQIADYTATANTELNGYLAEVHFIDGQALTPASFGETNSDTNQWQAIEYSGSYGSNGFYLKFQDSAALGDDSSGNTNDFTATNLVATDQVLDSPTRNYCTLNALDFSTGTLSEGNLKWVSTGAAGNGAFGSFAFDIASTDNKYYFEVLKVSGESVIGVVPDNVLPSNLSRPGSYTYYSESGTKYSGVTSSTYGASYTDGDIISVAVGAGSITFYKNGASQGVAFTGLTGDFKPALYEVTATFVANFGQDSSFAGAKTTQGNGGDGEDFYYTPPTGYKALNTDNLDDPAIALPTDHFETVLYTGTGASHTISSLDFAPDLTWHKSRSYGSSNALFDSVRGGNNVLSSNGTGAEVTYSDMITAFSSNGFTMGADASQAWINQSSYTYASWNWKAGGTASSNTDGSLTTSVSANTTAGFSIISYTGDDTQNSTIGHGLSQAPELAIFKPRGSSSNEWTIWMGHITGTYNEYLYLNTTAALASSAYYFGTSGPVATASTLKLGESGRTNNSASPGMICYAFHSVEGYNKIGSYNPNNSTDGPFIYTGFKPSFVLIKAMTGPDGRSWAIEDNKRDPYNPADKHLNPNLSNAEAVSSVHYVDFVSNGFKLRNAHQWSNYTGYTYFYLAFAESPFKTANAK